jgi:hypothetical protein
MEGIPRQGEIAAADAIDCGLTHYIAPPPRRAARRPVQISTSFLWQRVSYPTMLSLEDIDLLTEVDVLVVQGICTMRSLPLISARLIVGCPDNATLPLP